MFSFIEYFLIMRIYTNVIHFHTYILKYTYADLASSSPAQTMTFVYTFCFLQVERSLARRGLGRTAT